MRALPLAALLALCGCAGSEIFRPQAFVPLPRHYRVRYLDAGLRRAMPDAWIPLGYRVDGDGRPTVPTADPLRWEQLAIDTDGDRTADIRGRVPRYDLQYEHEEDGAEVWVSTIPVEPRRGRRSLSVLAHQLVEGLFGAGFVAHLGGSRTAAFQTSIVDETPAQVGGAPAHVITFSIAPVDLGGAVARQAGETTTIVLIRPPRQWRGEELASPAGGLPMLILVGLSARTDRYALHRPALDSLLDRIDVRPAE